MRAYRFAGVLRKHLRPYTLVRGAHGSYDEDGEWQEAPSDRKQLRGLLQPLSARLRAQEGGGYLETDRMLYTTHSHDAGELIEHDGIQYRVAEETERGYSDVNQYVLRRVVAHAPVS